MKKTLGIMMALVCLMAFTATAHAEKQPRMKTAVELLEEAAHQLENATADKGGHRIKAIRLIREAIAEVKLGIKYDNRHRRD